ncbi:MAG: FAD-dependent oxidoreductase [Eubacteriales bacterium]|nr:FAD-dependent oxidoreductase [Eubacteriales bacterium]
MRKFISLLLILMLAVVPFTAGSAATFTAGEYEASAQGFGGAVTVKVTVDDEAVTAVEVSGPDETPALGGAAIETFNTTLVGVSDAESVEAVSGATVTSTAVKEALASALAQARGEAPVADAALAFTAGTYTGTAQGYNGPVSLSVTFSDAAVTAIEVGEQKETAYVGNLAFDPMIADIIAANGTGVDGVSGATFSSAAVRGAVNDAAEQAGCTNISAFKTNKVEVTAQAPIEETYDVVIVGAGGAGIAAAAQAAQDGSTVLVIEKNAQVGGNTLVSGGQYQSVMPYLVWDPADPDATTGVGYDGNTYNKVVESIATLDELKIILNWSEEPFDEAYYKDHEFVAGDVEELSKHGVHAEYLPTLQALKSEIQAYLDWAEPKIAEGAGELTLFSTVNLHIFQTYYGGLRPTADMSSWIYGDYDLVNQFIQGGQELKQWLEAQGSTFVEDTQPTLIGALWYRENEFVGATINGEEIPGRWGTYFAAPMNTLLATSATAASNKIMLRTTAEELIVTDGKVTGVKGTMYDGTPVTAHATKGVVLATGGYAANLNMVVDSNVYWSEEYVSTSTKTTNRSSLQGDGITMGQAVGADVTGMGFTQMMPISWIDNGNLAFGGGNYAVYINPTTGKRFVDETSERDVLSLAEFRNGIEHNGTKGVFIELANAEAKIPGPYLYQNEDVEWRQYVRTVDQLAELFTELGLPTDAATVRATIESYDKAIMAGEQPEDVKKTNPNRLIGSAEKDENGKYLPDTYTLDGVALRVRFMAPSTHHTMGGLKVDTDRHVLSTDGAAIPGLYAAGEVTGGIHGGNRLGGNAIVEIFVSGRTAAQAIEADNK